MRLIYSALGKTTTNTHLQISLQEEEFYNTTETATRYLAYKTTCNKYRSEIAAIQKYMPGWMPTPPAP